MIVKFSRRFVASSSVESVEVSHHGAVSTCVRSEYGSWAEELRVATINIWTYSSGAGARMGPGRGQLLLLAAAL